MDVLSDILRVIKLDSAIYFNAEMCEPWCLQSPAARRLAPILGDDHAHIIIFHLLCEGRAYVHLADGQRTALSAGDVVAFPHGDGHTLGNGPRVTAIDAGAALPGVLAHGLDLMRLGGSGAPSRFICGFMACDAQLSRTFLAGLAPLIKVGIRDEPSGQWLENALKFSVAQAANREAGVAATLAKLSEAVLGEVLRRHLRSRPDGDLGWLAGARDAEIGRALRVIHERPAHAWTISELAAEAGLSRTVLTLRFRRLLGESPMAYVMRWRLGLGARALTATNHGVAQIASEVGYESEAAFNRAFKRVYGQPPARYRKRKDANEPAAS